MRSPLAIFSASFLVALFVAPFLLLTTTASRAAENFSCGPGGKPDPKTAACICPAGKIERTTSGTSRCIDKPSGPAPKPTAGTGGGTTTTGPSVGGSATIGGGGKGQSTNPVVVAPILPTCPGSQIATVDGCVDRCAEDEIWRGGTCVDRCAEGERWSGGTCEKLRVPKPRVTCAEGKVADAASHCCYPGQTWGESSGRCRGAPRCPDGYVADGESCKIAECIEGTARAEDGVHCCWPGQEWSRSTKSCVGVASCPDGFAPMGDACRPLRVCGGKGLVALDADHCCYRGQHWGTRDDGVDGCAGEPNCPRGLVPHGDDCVKESEAEEKESTEMRSTFLGAGYFMYEIGLTYSLHKDVNYRTNGTDPTATAPNNTFPVQVSSTGLHSLALTVGIAVHLPGFPLRFSGYVDYGSLHAPDPTCSVPSGESGNFECPTPSDTGTSSYYAYRLAAEFAPLSLPNLAVDRVSYVNPFVGLELRGYTTTVALAPSSDGTSTNNLSGNTVAIVFGNVFFWRPFAITAAGGVSLTGPDGRPQFTLNLTAGWIPHIAVLAKPQ